MELLKLAPAIQNHILNLALPIDGNLTEERLRKVAALTDPRQQQLRLRAPE